MLDLIPVCYWHEFLDMVFFFKCTHGMIVINNDLLPTILNRERATRFADPNCLLFNSDEINESVEHFTKRLDRQKHYIQRI